LGLGEGGYYVFLNYDAEVDEWISDETSRKSSEKEAFCDIFSKN
jgi:hypothetical protein